MREKPRSLHVLTRMDLFTTEITFFTLGGEKKVMLTPDESVELINKVLQSLAEMRSELETIYRKNK
jgi:hypothetical protein